MKIGDSIVKIKDGYSLNIIKRDSTYTFNLKMSL